MRLSALVVRSFLALAPCAVLALPHAAIAAKPPAEKAPPAPLKVDVETAEQLYAKLEYEKANEVAQKVIVLKGLTHDQLVRTYRVLAVTYAVLEKEEDARDAFVLLLTYDPDYKLDPNLGPRVLTPFQEAKGYWRAQPMKPGIDNLLVRFSFQDWAREQAKPGGIAILETFAPAAELPYLPGVAALDRAVAGCRTVTRAGLTRFVR